MLENIKEYLTDISSAENKFKIKINFNCDYGKSQYWKNFPYHNDVEKSYSFVEYQRAYLMGSVSEYLTIDVIFLGSSDLVVAHWSFNIVKNSQGWSVLSGNGFLNLPTYIVNLGSIEKTKILEKCISICTYIKKKLTIKEIFWCNDKYETCVKFEAQKEKLFHLHRYSLKFEQLAIIDCTAESSLIWRGLRRSYKPLINKAQKSLLVDVMDKSSLNDGIWDDFRNCHFKASGNKITRKDDTWNQQKNSIMTGNAFLITIKLKDSAQFVGGFLFNSTQHNAYYSVGASDRDKRSLNIGHIALWSSIKHCKSSNIKFLNLGTAQYSTIDNSASDKLKHIAKFKKGFVSDTQNIKVWVNR